MLNWTGFIIGVATFLLIGIFHVVVIKAEYYFSKNIWPAFALIGTVTLVGSLFIEDTLSSVLAAVFGITCLWCIKELFDQEKRVKKGWFPQNPKRKHNAEHSSD